MSSGPVNLIMPLPNVPNRVDCGVCILIVDLGPASADSDFPGLFLMSQVSRSMLENQAPAELQVDPSRPPEAQANSKLCLSTGPLNLSRICPSLKLFSMYYSR